MVLEDITACSFKRDSKLIWSEPLAGVFRAGAAATRHILPNAKIDVVVFPANFRRYSQAKSGFVVSTREFVSSVSGDRNEIERRSPACKRLGSCRGVETGPQRSEDREGQAGRIPPKTGQVDRGCDR